MCRCDVKRASAVAFSPAGTPALRSAPSSPSAPSVLPGPSAAGAPRGGETERDTAFKEDLKVTTLHFGWALPECFWPSFNFCTRLSSQGSVRVCVRCGTAAGPSCTVQRRMSAQTAITTATAPRTAMTSLKDTNALVNKAIYSAGELTPEVAHLEMTPKCCGKRGLWSCSKR